MAGLLDLLGARLGGDAAQQLGTGSVPIPARPAVPSPPRSRFSSERWPRTPAIPTVHSGCTTRWHGTTTAARSTARRRTSRPAMATRILRHVLGDRRDLAERGISQASGLDLAKVGPLLGDARADRDGRAWPSAARRQPRGRRSRDDAGRRAGPARCPGTGDAGHVVADCSIATATAPSSTISAGCWAGCSASAEPTRGIDTGGRHAGPEETQGRLSRTWRAAARRRRPRPRRPTRPTRW